MGVDADADEQIDAIDEHPGLRGAADARGRAQRQAAGTLVRDYVRDMDDGEQEAASRSATSCGSKVVTTLVLARAAKDPRETHIHIKGDFTRPGDVVTPGVPAVLPPLKAAGRNADRLDLAQWLVDPENPLTARVTVNRVWQQYFGRGHRRDGERLRHPGHAADAPRAARLAGDGVHAPRAGA